ncbi:MAG: hypothetical protein HUU01_21925 [Saprospiraceae bacterium]|nr:hypothetical protein [Saprospiraceae bacterium]
MWQKLTTAALLGLGRSAFPEDLRTVLQARGIDPGASPEKALLDGAAVLLRQRYRHPVFPVPKSPALSPPDLGEERLGSPAMEKILDKIFDNSFFPALPELLSLMAARSLHVPPAYLPGLLEMAIGDANLHALLQVTGGPRANWLISLNPRWGRAGRKTTKGKTAERMPDADFNATALAALTQHRDLEKGQPLVTLLSTPGYAWSDELVFALVANFSGWLDRHFSAPVWAVQHYRVMLELAAYGCDVHTCQAFEGGWAGGTLEPGYFRRIIAFRKEMADAF